MLNNFEMIENEFNITIYWTDFEDFREEVLIELDWKSEISQVARYTENAFEKLIENFGETF